MQTWVNFYKDRVNEHYFNHVVKKYSYFIDLINLSIEPQMTVVELGCGICNVTKALALRNPNNLFRALDLDPEMLKLSVDNLATDPIRNVQIERGNILRSQEIPEGDIAHSHGVLEHFSDDEIRQIISIQKMKFKEIYHYVPSSKYEVPSFGDERLMTKEQWQAICQPDEIISFNDDYDLILIWNAHEISKHL